MSAMVQTPKLQASEDFDQCGAEYQSLSNQDYYSQLEALKRMHLQNIAHLDVMYLNELSASKGKASQEAQMSDKDEIDSAQEADESLPAKRGTNTIPRQDIKLQQNSVSKSDISGSREMKVEKEKKEKKEKKEEKEEEEKEEEAAGQASRQSSGVRDEAKSSKPRAQPERWAASKPASAAAKHQPRAPSRRPPGAEPSSRIAKVTVPKPFKMMLREDDKKRRNQKTRSEVELENTLLRKELTELRECRRQFRATPAPPPRTRPPLSEVFSQRAAGGRSRTTSLDRAARADPGTNRRTGGSRDISPEPFSFIERERRKREVRLEAVLSRPTSREERWVFKARPLPRLYRAASDDYHLFGATETHSRGEEQHRGPDVSRERLKHTGRLEDERGGVEVEEEETEEKSEDGEHGADESTDGAETPILCSNWRLRRKPSLASKGLLVEGETGGVRGGREGETRGQEQLPTGKSDYISV
ncbi:trichohyalin-like [Clupea harengus]|uniref:Trichohyalin-like n=1 Tax=Clupea harengus TaxID=7950 RepID=A0A8M1KDZ6_CLUHA|nr:trichohyalin-like [Clupea harengus]